MAAQQCGWAPVFIAPGRGRTSQARIRHTKRPALFGVGGGIDAVLRLGDARYTRLSRMGGHMGIKWTARLRVDFEMEEGAQEQQAETWLRTSAGQLRYFIEDGTGIRKTLVKRGSAKVEIMAQGPTA